MALSTYNLRPARATGLLVVLSFAAILPVRAIAPEEPAVDENLLIPGSGGSAKIAIKGASQVNGEFSAKVSQMAEITGTKLIFEELKDVQNQLRSAAPGESVHRELLINRLLYLRTKLMQYLQTASLEVNSAKAEVEMAIAKIDDSRALIVEKRARVLKRNSVINFVSGGVTKMVGYSLALGDTTLTTNLLEILDGGIQSGLSVLTVREQEEEKHYSQNLPPLLLTVINGNNDISLDYSTSVWQYLNSHSFSGEEIISASTINAGGDTTGGETRRDKLIAAWSSSGMIARHHKVKPRGVTPQGAKVGQGKSFSAQLLEDRAAMLSDLKSVVAQMNNSLMQLSQAVKVSYLQDPPL